MAGYGCVVLDPCGSRGAYLRHHKNSETPCELCLVAMRPIWAATDLKRRRRRVELEAPCGTPSAYRRHLRRGELVDEACRLAVNRAQSVWYRDHRRRVRRGTLKAVVADFLETHGLVEMRELVVLIQYRHPDITHRQIRDAVKGLRNDGVVVSEVDEWGVRYQYVA